MSNFASLITVAVVAGIAIALQSQFMGLMNKGIGTIETAFVTYGSGALLIAIVFFFFLGRGGNLGAWQSVPWYAFSTGILGVIIVAAVGYSTPRLGLVTTFTIIVAVQFMVGALLDHFGLLGAVTRPLNLLRVLGMIILLLGTWLIIR